MPAFVRPPISDDAAFNTQRAVSVAHWRASHACAQTGNEEYATILAANRLTVSHLLSASNHLTALDGALLAAHPKWLTAARYLCGPPISADDLETLVKQAADRKTARAAVIVSLLDLARFPWLEAARPARPAEITAAVLATSALMTAQQVATRRRARASRTQEKSVADALSAAGYTAVRAQGVLEPAATWLRPGQFCAETYVLSAKCDVPVRLWDGRFLFIECKSSNSESNSTKRLSRETGGKARLWSSAAGFGDDALTVAVLAGAYTLANLREAQSSGLSIIWEHDLQPLQDFVSAARP